MEENNLQEKKQKLNHQFVAICLLAVIAIVIGSITKYTPEQPTSALSQNTGITVQTNAVIPASGIVLPVSFGTLGPQMTESGVIDRDKFLALYSSNPTLKQEAEALLSGTEREFTVTPQNSGLILNYLWAFGLGNKNDILDYGEMSDPNSGGAGNFASTGGWTIAKGNAMDHYSRHAFVTFTEEQQALVDKISRGIYRPCCGNSTHFPDCNHGMAMLGLLELMASQGMSEQQMWQVALAVNSYWFPDTYLTIAEYKKMQGVEWKDVSPEEVLGKDYSSAGGFAHIMSVVKPKNSSGGASCGV